MSYDIIPLCINCQHYSKAGSYHLCGREVSPVDGSAAYFADQERKWGGCKGEGKYFRMKEVQLQIERPLVFWKRATKKIKDFVQ